MGSESSGVPESPSEVIEEPFNGNNPPVFSPSYMYPGYMFGAPIYNIDGKYSYFETFIKWCEKKDMTVIFG